MRDIIAGVFIILDIQQSIVKYHVFQFFLTRTNSASLSTGFVTILEKDYRKTGKNTIRIHYSSHYRDRDRDQSKHMCRIHVFQENSLNFYRIWFTCLIRNNVPPFLQFHFLFYDSIAVLCYVHL